MKQIKRIQEETMTGVMIKARGWGESGMGDQENFRTRSVARGVLRHGRRAYLCLQLVAVTWSQRVATIRTRITHVRVWQADRQTDRRWRQLMTGWGFLSTSQGPAVHLAEIQIKLQGGERFTVCLLTQYLGSAVSYFTVTILNRSVTE
jgi:hypothetical protein